MTVQFNKPTCRWTILGTAAEVQRSAERGRVLAALQDAAGPMTPTKRVTVASTSDRYVLLRVTSELRGPFSGRRKPTAPPMSRPHSAE
jgi:hypothetical protein